MANLSIKLTGRVTLLVKIVEKGHSKYKEVIPVETTLDDILWLGVPEILFDKGIFEAMGHPVDHFEMLSFEIDQTDLIFPVVDNPLLTEEYKKQLLNPENYKNQMTPENYRRYITGNWLPDDDTGQKIHEELEKSILKDQDSELPTTEADYAANLVKMILKSKNISNEQIYSVFNWLSSPNYKIHIVGFNIKVFAQFAHTYFKSGIKDVRLNRIFHKDQAVGVDCQYAFALKGNQSSADYRRYSEIVYLLESRGTTIIEL